MTNPTSNPRASGTAATAKPAGSSSTVAGATGPAAKLNGAVKGCLIAVGIVLACIGLRNDVERFGGSKVSTPPMSAFTPASPAPAAPQPVFHAPTSTSSPSPYDDLMDPYRETQRDLWRSDGRYTGQGSDPITIGRMNEMISGY